MENILLIYASMSGNTEKMAFAIAEGLRGGKVNLTVKDIFEIRDEVETLDLSQYDALLIGTYTWMDGDVPDEFLTFYDDLPSWDLNGQKAAVFGSYDSTYGNDGAAIELFMDALKDAGAEVVMPPLKIELMPDSYGVEMCKKYGRKFIAKLWKKRKVSPTA